MKKLILRVVMLGILAGAGWWGYSYVRQMPQRRQEIPLAKVRQGEIVISAFSRGELRALRSEAIVAPNLMGTVQVTQLAAMGSFAREKDLIVEFDDSEVLSRLEEQQLNLQSLDESIKRQEAELAIRNNQDQVDLLQAKYAVRRAELQVQKNELLGDIDKRKNILSLEQAKRTLVQTESDVKSRQEQAQAQLALVRQNRQRANLEMSREQARLRQTRVLATMSGLVAIRQNTFGGARQFGSQIPDIREGDQVQPGMPVADILDLSEVELVAKIGELDRANLVEGQDAVIQLDALAGKKIHGKIKSMSGTATANVFSGDPSKKFEVLFSVDMKELLTTVGATPEQIREILATAEKNRNRPVTRTAFSGFPAMGGMEGGSARGMPGAMGGNFDPSAFAGRGQGQTGGRQPGAGNSGSEGQAQGGRQRDAGAAGQTRGSGRGTAGEGAQDAARGGAESGQRSGRGQRGGADFGAMGFPGRGGPQFNQKDLDAAKLPPPPEEDSGLQVLLRPGLLADVEVVIEKIPNAIYIPAQAVFERDGKPVAYVKAEKGFDERPVQLLKRSEATWVISSGLKPGEEIALVNPTRQPAKKKEEPKQGGGAGPMGGAGGSAK
ncbi:MAG: HlyD family efflux transporter periplasmic adaptor subunit [Bryobacterales bacterium]|nr:HlyD family efflux transporter periplasmic adaptor subunit [Bryobacterales bacterium]